ncbi:hypothetical protein DL96DRAFT_1045442 [Flagelloscypha sp. PMI_526]|nr:hypothetical protein DL96DRAFT_1045442 [Flagelloscypha sp. PMI_526]
MSEFSALDPNSPLPFADSPLFDHWREPWPHEEPIRTLAEQRMIQLSWNIRAKPGWIQQTCKSKVRTRLKSDILAKELVKLKEEQLTEKMVDFVLEELSFYREMSDLENGIQHACDDSVFVSTNLIPLAIEKDLLALPHFSPSDNPLIFGFTRSSSEDLILPFHSDNNFSAKQASWLPSNFEISSDGVATLTSPFIAGLPINTSHHYVLEKIVSRALPMLERVLGAVDRNDRPSRGPYRCPSKRVAFECIWDRIGEDNRKLFDRRSQGSINMDEEADYSGFPGETRAERWEVWVRSRKSLVLPEALAFDGEAARDDIRLVSLKGRTIQILFEIRDVDDGGWRVQGSKNERIVACAAHYFDIEPGASISFRARTNQPRNHQDDDDLCLRWLYGFKDGQALTQSRGTVPLRSSTTVAWPNIYSIRHTRGSGTCLLLSLVDPFSERILSTTDISKTAERPPDTFIEIAKSERTVLAQAYERKVQNAIFQATEFDC